MVSFDAVHLDGVLRRFDHAMQADIEARAAAALGVAGVRFRTPSDVAAVPAQFRGDVDGVGAD